MQGEARFIWDDAALYVGQDHGRRAGASQEGMRMA
jgi:hypothetical protein